MLRLIRANGTIFELFAILQYSTPGFAAGLINALDSLTVATLIDKTIAKRRSIGTLDLALRGLDKRNMSKSDERTQLTALEDHLGGAPMLRLIRANGTILDLLRIMHHSTPSFAAGLIWALDRATVSTLIDKTIADHRSIGTLGLALRELAKRNMPAPDGRTQLAALEAHLGGAPMLRLIRTNGTIFELFMILRYITPDFAAGLINALDPLTVSTLVDKTIADHRSIGTLDLALRDLAKRNMPAPDGRTQLAALEAHFGGAPLLRLIRANGTIFELFMILRRITRGSAAGLINSLDRATVDTLIDKTITKRRSIGTLSLALKELQQSDQKSKLALEHAIGVEGFWRLVLGVGDLNDLSYLLTALTREFRESVLDSDAALSLTTWVNLSRRGGFYPIVRFVKDSIWNLPPKTRLQFEAAISEVLPEVVDSSAWPDLSSGLAMAGQIDDALLRTTLATAAFVRLDRQDIDTLSFSDFNDAASGLYCLWQRRERSRSEIGRQLWSLLPERRSWPKDSMLFVAGRLLLQIARSDQIAQRDAERLLQSFSGIPRAVKLEKVFPGPLYLFIWNLFALWQARGKSVAEQFADLQPEEFWIKFEGVVADQAAKARRNEDKLKVLALAGVLTLVNSGRAQRLTQVLRGHIWGISRVITDADELTFVPAVLAFRGLLLIDDRQTKLSPARRSRLLAKAAEYDEQGAAIDFLCDWLRNDNRSKVPA